ncbi:3,4-dihydroxyphenylacetate 2,3-dioxygenase [Ramlibacter sp.]|uniref:3,4-dihydroxyphenylacetate 2,3-dioxygenase n=1 Tax=Ramlibacter sp. TaxID=1917967 RepID=UPI003D117082
MTPPALPFNIQKLGYIEYQVTDLERSRDFYVDIIGLFETARDSERVYLRAIEDREHHCIVLKRAPRAGVAHFAFKVESEQDLDALEAHFRKLERPMRWIAAGERRAQGRTLLVQDPLGFPVAFYAKLEPVEWFLQKYHLHRHGCPTRLDHVNVLTPDAQKGYEWYCNGLGFRPAEITEGDPPESRIWASWLFRKSTVHDIAVMTGDGPAVHHAGLSLMEPMGVIRACDALAGAGYADSIERGPARHGISNALFVYVRDPDGNRFELYTGDYLTTDRNAPPVRWRLDDARRQTLWGPPPPRRWFEESMAVSSIETGEEIAKQPALMRAIPTYVS